MSTLPAAAECRPASRRRSYDLVQPDGHILLGRLRRDGTVRILQLPALLLLCVTLAVGSHWAAQPWTFAGCRLSRRCTGMLRTQSRPGITKIPQRAAVPVGVTLEQRLTELDERVKSMAKPENELYWRVLAYCTACRTPWCKLPWRKSTCLKGEAKAEGSRGNRCDMPWEEYTDILVKSVPLLSRQKAQVLTKACWQSGDSDPGGIGTVNVATVPRPAAEGYCMSLAKNGVQCSVVPDSFYRGGPSGGR
mmetsp:Transcript_2038/g.4608  ORF Transcript_2038/g.4608 Transcript_2038/m.4608 type:complete len:249 (+) Transcript_2038:49-795(+)